MLYDGDACSAPISTGKGMAAIGTTIVEALLTCARECSSRHIQNPIEFSHGACSPTDGRLCRGLRVKRALQAERDVVRLCDLRSSTYPRRRIFVSQDTLSLAEVKMTKLAIGAAGRSG